MFPAPLCMVTILPHSTSSSLAPLLSVLVDYENTNYFFLNVYILFYDSVSLLAHARVCHLQVLTVQCILPCCLWALQSPMGSSSKIENRLNGTSQRQHGAIHAEPYHHNVIVMYAFAIE